MGPPIETSRSPSARSTSAARTGPPPVHLLSYLVDQYLCATLRCKLSRVARCGDSQLLHAQSVANLREMCKALRLALVSARWVIRWLYKRNIDIANSCCSDSHHTTSFNTLMPPKMSRMKGPTWRPPRCIYDIDHYWSHINETISV